MTRIWSVGYLKPEAPFHQLFPEGRVPLQSIIPMIPREEGAPECYLVNSQELSDWQIQGLAEQLYEMWRPECESLEMAIAYIRDGLPLKREWFNGVATDMRAFMPDDYIDEPREEDYEVCPDCGNNGFGEEDITENCPTCGGTGYL